MTNPDLAAPRLTLRSPADLIALTPYLLGFHPARSVVAVGFAGRQLAFAARSDLPGPGAPPARLARRLVDVVARQRVDTVALIGYGPAVDVDPLLDAVGRGAGNRGILTREVLRVDGGRWWSYVCGDPACCPPEGTPIELASSPVSALCTVDGLTAAASREELARQLAPIVGPARTAMTQATGRARRRYARLVAAAPGAGASVRRAAVAGRSTAEAPDLAYGCAAGEWARGLADGTAAVRAAIERYEGGGVLDDDELAWLSVLLDVPAVRDAAWRASSGAESQRRLWMDVTRRADPGLVAAPACLLAVAAWRAGDGVLAGLALERALRADPAYALAHLLLHGLQQGLSPSTLDHPAAVDRLAALLDRSTSLDRPGSVDRSAPDGRPGALTGKPAPPAPASPSAAPSTTSSAGPDTSPPAARDTGPDQRTASLMRHRRRESGHRRPRHLMVRCRKANPTNS